ncbi:MAG: tetratricopeptide repeat protein [Candidatus Cloacimonetes bacterium]|nr:tetratricopeptide repeat protein [Candidatus Cloacimonadota bacterium]
MTEIALWLANSIASYGFNKLLDQGYGKLFKSEKEFKDQLQKLINNSIDEYAKEHPIERMDGKFPFYESQVFMDILLKYRLFDKNEILDYQSIKVRLSENHNILIPTQEEIEKFFLIFDRTVKEDEILEKIFCKKSAPKEIFKISSIMQEIYEKQDEILAQSIENSQKLDTLLKKEVYENKSTKYLTNAPTQEILVVGREKDLEKVRNELDADRSLLLMNGLGGIGKTTLARKYLVEFADVYDHIVWLEISQGVVEAFAGSNVLHSNLGLVEDIKTLKPEDAFALIMNRLKNMDGNNLMILDDAKEDFASMRKQLPGKPNWKLLVTSRQNFTGIKPFHLDFLEPEDARQLFYEYYTTEKNDALLEKIFEPVKYHTLVVELFAKMAMMNELTLSELAEKADAEGITISIPTDVDVDHSESNIENILEYLIRTFPVNELPEGLIIILRKLAIMPSIFEDYRVLDFFWQVEDKNKEEFHLNLNLLTKRGWLERTRNEYKLHGIISQLVLNEYPPDYDFYKEYISLLLSISLFEQDKENHIDKLFIIPYCLNIIVYLSIDNDRLIYLMKNVASLLSYHGNYSLALEINKEALTNAEKIGNRRLELQMISAMGLNYENMGRYNEARELYEQILCEAGEIFGENHPNIAATKSNLANVCSRLRECTKAKDLLEQALKSDIEIFGENHPRVVAHKSNLASVYGDMREYTKARGIMEQVLESAIKQFGEMNPNVATAYNNLGQISLAMQEHDPAWEYIQKALLIAKIVWGAEHPNTISINKSIIYIIKSLTYIVLKGNGSDICDVLSKINKSLLSTDVDMKKYIEFLYVLIQKGDAMGYYEKLSPDFKELVNDVRNEMQQRTIIETLTKFTIMAIKSHETQDDHIEEIQQQIEELREEANSEVRKYYDFLLAYAKGIYSEELKDMIDKPLWEMFIKIKNGELN